MKTTVEVPDELCRRAKAEAASMRTSLAGLMKNACGVIIPKFPISLRTLNISRTLAAMLAIADTGPLVAFFDRGEQHHRWIAERIQAPEAPLLVCEPVWPRRCIFLPGTRERTRRENISGTFSVENVTRPCHSPVPLPSFAQNLAIIEGWGTMFSRGCAHGEAEPGVAIGGCAAISAADRRFPPASPGDG